MRPIVRSSWMALCSPPTVVVSTTAVFVVVGIIGAIAPQARGEKVLLKNGMTVEGIIAPISELPTQHIKMPGGSDAGGVDVKTIAIVDNGLTRTIFRKQGDPTPSAEKVERIFVKQHVPTSGSGVAVVGGTIDVTPFDKWGRRTYSMAGPKGRIDVVQGITEITPTYVKVEGLTGANAIIWDMRLSTASMPSKTLREVLRNAVKADDIEGRLRIVRLLIQSNRIRDAREELAQAREDFPKLAAMEEQEKELIQLNARRLIEEIRFRGAAGQNALAYKLASTFPGHGVAGALLVEVNDIKADYDKKKEQWDRLKNRLSELLAQVDDEKLAERLRPYVEEIRAQRNVNTLDRLVDFERFQDAGEYDPPAKLAFAVSGWLLNSTAIENPAVAASLGKTRDLVRRYLRVPNQGERERVLAAIAKEEGGTPAYVAQLVKTMRPPLDPYDPEVTTEKDRALPLVEAVDARETARLLPATRVVRQKEPGKTPKPLPMPKPPRMMKKEEVEAAAEKTDAEEMDPVAEAAEEAVPETMEEEIPAEEMTDEEAAAEESKPGRKLATGEDPKTPGLFRLSFAPLAGQPPIEYVAALPPEYDPLRKYPCIVTMGGLGATAEDQIEWWAGSYDATIGDRNGQATRQGYIVLAPRWLREHQPTYEFSAREHAAALGSLRDAMRRFSIDSDRVFLSGHGVGGDAAWDIAFAHPDLWAGLICVCGRADKYVTRYWENARRLPLYFVEGEKEGDKRLVNNQEYNRYLMAPGQMFNLMIHEFIGRGPHHFHEDTVRMFEWMRLHKRDFFPEKFERVVSMRPWDNFFWWLELDAMPQEMMTPPAMWSTKNPTPVTLDGERLKNANTVRVKPGKCKGKVWVSPEMGIDFDAKPTVKFSGMNRDTKIPPPQVKTILEDVRTRADREHPFWSFVEFNFLDKARSAKGKPQSR